MTNPEIAKFLVSVIPQILTVVISVAGIFGKGMIDSSATQLADFAATGGANRKAVRESSSALASSLISITTFFSTFAVLIILCLAGMMSNKQHLVYILLTAVSVALVGFVISYLVKNSAYELSINRVRSPWPFGEPKFLKSTYTVSIDRMNLFMMVAILGLAFL